MLDVAETIAQSAMERTESRGAHQRTDFPARDDEKFLAHSLAYRNAAGRPQVEYIPVTITRWPPAERVYGGNAEWRTGSRSRSHATIPRVTAEPRVTSYEVPLHKEWVVLDALNYIKDQLDGSLTFRWSCRMGVCGSCGMMVNGEPKLTCATFLSDYAPGPVRVEPMRHFPIVRDLVVDTSDFLMKLTRSKPWIIRTVEKPMDGEYYQTPAQLDEYRQFSMCINCLLCYAACPIYGLDPQFTRTSGNRPGTALQQGFT